MVEWFLGTHVQWLVPKDKVSVHLSQTGFTAHLVEDNNAQEKNISPNATPYQSGLHIDAILESNEDNKDPAPVERKQKNRSICQETSTRDTAYKGSLELCASIVLLFLDGCSKWYVSVVFLAG